MAYTLGTAAKATGRNKTTILRAIKDGKLSALRDAASGAWLIEPSELHRVYRAIANATDATPGATPDATARPTDAAVDAAGELRARLGDALDQVADLRRRLDQADANHRQALDRLAAAQERIAALLTDQRQAPAPVPAAPPRRAWWKWSR